MEQLPKKFHITKFNPKTHQIDVYFTEHRSLEPFVIDLPVVGGLYSEGKDLENYILTFRPPVKEEKPHVEAMNADYIHNLVENVTFLSNVDAGKKSAALQKRRALLAASDWTQLPDTQDSFDEEEKIRWKQYRQQLRDVTRQVGWPTDINWPKQPFLFEVTTYE